MSWSADLLDLLIASRTLGGGTLEGRQRQPARAIGGANSEHWDLTAENREVRPNLRSLGRQRAELEPRRSIDEG
jgi:hypothetical protein